MSDLTNIAPALVAALAELTIVEKGRTAKIPTKDGKSYSYDYADIGDVVKLTRPVLASHGLVALTPIHDHGNGLACTVAIIHSSGERLDFGPFPFDGARDAQATGSAVTYFRRYALVAALGMAAGDDDDGASAKASQNAPKAQEQAQERPATSRPTEKSAYNALIGHMVSAGKDEADAVALAASLWSELKPQLEGEHLVEGEWKRIIVAADERLT